MDRIHRKELKQDKFALEVQHGLDIASSHRSELMKWGGVAVAVLLLIGGIFLGLFVNGMMGGYGALMAELYPTHARGTAQNVLWSIGRAVGGFGPLAIGALATHYSFGTAITLLASIYIVDLLATIFLIPELRGVELE